MSSRQLRKLQKQRELERLQEAAAQEEPESSEEDAPVVAKPRVSLFAALGGDDNEDEGHEDEEETPASELVKEESELEQKPAAGSGKNKKKKKKKKQKGKAAAAQPKESVKDEDEDEIDKAIKELNIKAQRGNETSAAAVEQRSMRRINELLKINPYHLKAVNEMRSLFGRDIIESAAAEEEQEERNRRRRGGPIQQQVDLETFLRGPPGAKKLPEISLRRNVFIQGREHWPLATAGGLTMREVGRAEDGSWTEYAYFHGREYDAVQLAFFTCVQMGDPMSMVHLLKKAPYHVSTLLQVSSVAKQDQNMALAAELCERALFTFGRMTTSAFRQNIEQGKARLDFRRPENRQFWLAGYHYLTSLIRKGTYRTALEWAKLLYTLDPKDPYAMRHFIHFLAVRAHESRWLVDVLEEMEKTSDDWDTVYLRQSLVLAKLQTGDVEGARAELAKGIKRVPWLYCTMFQELNLDAPPSIWGINTDSDARSFWVKLYIYQTKDLWNNTQAIGLLQDVAKSLDQVDTAALPSDDPPADLGTTRLAYLEGQTSLLALAPRELLARQPNYEFDPLPPPEEENIFTGEGARLPWLRRDQQSDAEVTEIEARLRNLFARQAAAAAMPGGAFPGGGFETDDEELPALDDDDDDELRRDIEAVANGNRAGLLETLIQMFGGGRNDQSGTGAENEESRDLDSHIEEAEGLPGAWPEDDDDDDNGARDTRDAIR